uniref:Uncharacterized protein n=1 Tax=Knipowitschia caucasica TaxID=637954 RepID=A0AAV2KDV2_KNICA
MLHPLKEVSSNPSRSNLLQRPSLHLWVQSLPPPHPSSPLALKPPSKSLSPISVRAVPSVSDIPPFSPKLLLSVRPLLSPSKTELLPIHLFVL